jgi:hypothetical protein
MLTNCFAPDQPPAGQILVKTGLDRQVDWDESDERLDSPSKKPIVSAGSLSDY